MNNEIAQLQEEVATLERVAASAVRVGCLQESAPMYSCTPRTAQELAKRVEWLERVLAAAVRSGYLLGLSEQVCE